jgi:hypothetical protein
MNKKTYRGFDAPIAFDINNYSILNTISAQQVLDELIFRVSFINDIQDEDEDIPFMFCNSPEWQSILSGNVLITSSPAQHNLCPCLPKMNGVEHLTVDTINWYVDYAKMSSSAIKDQETPLYLHRTALDDEKLLESICYSCCLILEEKIDYVTYCNEFDLEFLCRDCVEVVKTHDYAEVTEDSNISEICATCDFPTLDVSKDIHVHDLLLGIDLKNQTDDEILISIKKMLNHARDKFNIPESIKLPSKLPSKYFEKIITYKIIPFLDLNIWWLFSKTKSSPLILSTQGEPISYGLFDMPEEIATLTAQEINEYIFNNEQSDAFINDTFLSKNLSKYMDFKNLRLAKTILNKRQLARKEPRPLIISEL